MYKFKVLRDDTIFYYIITSTILHFITGVRSRCENSFLIIEFGIFIRKYQNSSDSLRSKEFFTYAALFIRYNLPSFSCTIVESKVLKYA